MRRRPLLMTAFPCVCLLVALPATGGETDRGPHAQPDTEMGMYTPRQHELYDGRYVIELDRFHEFSPCQDGGIAAFLFEHGNSGCGDANWPKSVLYVAGWGYGTATLDGKRLYEDYEIHFMVTQGMRDRETLKVRLEPSSGEAGAVNPAAQQLDFYIRSPARNEANHPDREVFDHFFAMEVTWQ